MKLPCPFFENNIKTQTVNKKYMILCVFCHFFSDHMAFGEVSQYALSVKNKIVMARLGL